MAKLNPRPRDFFYITDDQILELLNCFTVTVVICFNKGESSESLFTSVKVFM